MTARTVVLFMVDQLAAKWLEQAREGIVDLPNFDALQAEGVTFDNAFSLNPVCSPSRATIATGMSPTAHGVGECGYDLDPDIPSFMAGLQADGWATGAFGKLHYVTQLETLHPDYRVYGYDVVANSEDARAGEWTEWARREHPEHYEAVLSTVWMTMAPDLRQWGPDAEDLRAQILRAQERFPASRQNAYELPFPAEVSQTAWITDRACDFIAAADPERDLFVHVSYVQPHNPFTPPAEYVHRVDVDAIPAPLPAAWQQDRIPYYAQDRYAQASYETDDWLRERQLYFADLAHLDHELGRVRAALSDAGRGEDVLLIFTSDHGEMLHDQGLLGKWERHYDPCVRIPLILTAPDASPGHRSELVDHTDIAATIYDWTGLPEPSVPVRNMDGSSSTLSIVHGESLLPSAREGGPSESWRDAVLIQSDNSHYEASPRSWARTVRTATHRFSRHLGGGGEQLFDLVADPGEQRNLAEVPEAAALRAELLTILAELTGRDGFPNSPRGLFRIGTW